MTKASNMFLYFSFVLLNNEYIFNTNERLHTMTKNLNGNGRQACTHCSYRSVSGMLKGHGKCPFHFTSSTWGLDWASKLYPNHPNSNKRVTK